MSYLLETRVAQFLIVILLFLGLSLFGLGFVSGYLVGRDDAVRQAQIAPIREPAAKTKPHPAAERTPEPAANETPEAMQQPEKAPAQPDAIASLPDPAQTEAQTEAQNGKSSEVFAQEEPASEATAPVSAYEVVVGRYLLQRSADELGRRLQLSGRTPTVVAYITGERPDWYEVRLGPFAEKEEAEQAADLLFDEQGLTADVVVAVSQPDKVDVDDVAASPPNPPEKVKKTVLKTAWSVQAGSFLTMRRAEAMVRDLMDAGYKNACMITLYDSADRAWRIAQLGAFDSEDKARQVAADYRNRENSQARVVSLDAGLLQERTVCPGNERRKQDEPAQTNVAQQSGDAD